MDLQTKNKKIHFLNNRLKKKKYIFLLLALFTFGVNIFAWFVFTAYTGIQVDANVVSWNVRFLDGSTEVHDALVSVAGLKPGMSEFSKSFTIQNMGEVNAEFHYEINSLTILGRTVDLSNVSDQVDYFQNYYPFSIEFESSKDVISPLDLAHFTIKINWLYEDLDLYYRLNNVYDYDSAFLYYKYVDDQYNQFTTSSSNYLSERDNLYLEKDDADTYFGMKCKEYEDNTGNACLKLDLTLIVNQKNE